MRELVQRLRSRSFGFVLVVVVALFVANAFALSDFLSPGTWMGTLGLFAPFALVAMANTPAIISGNGGIDISAAANMNFVNVLFVVVLLPHGLGRAEIAIPLLLIAGALVGLCNGVMVAVLRYQPVIATLAAYFILTGISLSLATNPVAAGQNWTNSFTSTPWPIVLIATPLVVWQVLARSAYVRNLLLVGSNGPAAFSAGIDVRTVTVVAYTLGGAFAALGGMALTSILRSADSSLALQYTLIGIAAVALGGTPFGGGAPPHCICCRI
jgi:ribose transport system permease protein